MTRQRSDDTAALGRAPPSVAETAHGSDALAAAPTVRELGEALYGAHWQIPMAAALGVNLRTVHHWAAGDYRPSAARMARLVGLLEGRVAAASEVLARGRALVGYFERIRS